MIIECSSHPFIARVLTLYDPHAHFFVSAAANDILSEPQALRESDVRAIIREHAFTLVLAYGSYDKRELWGGDLVATMQTVLLEQPTMLESIVRRGTRLTKAEIEKLAREPAYLVKAAIEVITETRCEFEAGRLEAAIKDELAPFIQLLKATVR